MHCTEAGWPSEKQVVSRHNQALGADLISVAGRSLGLHQTPIEDRCFPRNMFHGKQWPPQEPRPRNSSVPSSRSSQSSGLCPKTLLVSVRLGGGTATGHSVTHHQEDERERRSNHSLGLRVCGPDAPSQSARHIYKEHRVGSPPRGPVRRQAPSLPSGVTRSQSA